MNSLIVTATRWSGGWELEIGEQQHTQVRNLCNARQQVVDYLDTMDESVDHADVDITIIPEIGALALSWGKASLTQQPDEFAVLHRLDHES